MQMQQNEVPQQLNACLNTHPGENMHSDGGCKDNQIVVYLFRFLAYFKYDIGLELQNIELYKTEYNNVYSSYSNTYFLVSEAFFLVNIVGYEEAKQKNC